MRRAIRLGLALVAALLVLAVVGALLSTPRGYTGPVSGHFDGQRFRSPVDRPHGTMLEFLSMRATTEYARWPSWVETEPAPRPSRRLASGEMRATFVNHATVLLQFGQVNMLTDPTWSARASPLAWSGPRRVHAPGVRFEDLPPIDAVVVSHNHYDHLDLPTLRRLAGRDRPRVLAGLGLESWLEDRGVGNVSELDWWQSVELTPEIRVTFAPAQHWSGRGLRDRSRTLWGSFVVEYGERKLYFAGDTAKGPHFAEVRKRFGAVDLALLPIGAYAPPSFMASAHLNPVEAVEAHGQLAAGRSMAIHFGCFQLSQESREEPVERLAAARRAAGLAAAEFVAPVPGQTLAWPQ